MNDELRKFRFLFLGSKSGKICESYANQNPKSKIIFGH